MKYGVHGGGHGHFDQLHFVLFDDGHEVIPDYGFSRWINIEPKSGGRYLPENDSYAMQTVAHNTVTVDQTSQSRAREDSAEARPAQRHFFSANSALVKVMSARADKQYPGVSMQRTMFLIRDPRLDHPAVVDVYRIVSAAEHTYDYPIHFRGQLIATNVKYAADTSRQVPLGAAFGYQHLWNEASGAAKDPVQLTWLDGNRYYSIITSPGPDAEVLFGRTGANDPNFNLISEPMMIVRRRAKNEVFASVIQPHGYFSEPEERSVQANPTITNVKVLFDDAEATIVEVDGPDGLMWTLMIANRGTASSVHHQVVGARHFDWTGYWTALGINESATTK
jgi:hypothetical protein